MIFIAQKNNMINSADFENDLPSMEPVLTNVTLNHEAGDIIR